jgi:hypothetical protein
VSGKKSSPGRGDDPIVAVTKDVRVARTDDDRAARLFGEPAGLDGDDLPAGQGSFLRFLLPFSLFFLRGRSADERCQSARGACFTR